MSECLESGDTISAVARGNGVAANLLSRWRRLMSEGGCDRRGRDEDVLGTSEMRRLEARVREPERLPGRKTMEVEILQAALAKSRAKKPTWQSASPLTNDSR